MPNGEPALLKRRQYLRREQAEQLWKALLCQGWRQRNLCGALVVSHKKRGLSTPLSASCFRSITLSFPSAEV